MQQQSSERKLADRGSMVAPRRVLLGLCFATVPAERARPGGLIAQFAASDPADAVAAARHVAGVVDAVDLNLGCPHPCARGGDSRGATRDGCYGAFLTQRREGGEIACAISSNIVRTRRLPPPKPSPWCGGAPSTLQAARLK